MNDERKNCILIVDDNPENLTIMNEILYEEYKVKVTTNPKMTLKIATLAELPDIILLDIMMPIMNGYEVCRQLKSNEITKDIPVIFVTAKADDIDETKGFELGAVDYITKPIHPLVLRARIKTHIALYNQNKNLEEKVKERTAELERTRLEIITKLGAAAEFKDPETGMHINRMSCYCYSIALSYGLSKDQSLIILNASPMHDIGKVGIPDNILLKPGKLDKNEWDIMTKHTIYGEKLLGNDDSELITQARICALTHHEKWNGKGYPNGVFGENIPLIGRIAAIADVFDALTSERPYKKAWSNEEAFKYIENESEQHFDPKLVSVFLENKRKIIEIKHKYSDSVRIPEK
jgi:putative two-component system response regulator